MTQQKGGQGSASINCGETQRSLLVGVAQEHKRHVAGLRLGMSSSMS